MWSQWFPKDSLIRRRRIWDLHIFSLRVGETSFSLDLAIGRSAVTSVGLTRTSADYWVTLSETLGDESSFSSFVVGTGLHAFLEFLQFWAPWPDCLQIEQNFGYQGYSTVTSTLPKSSMSTWMEEGRLASRATSTQTHAKDNIFISSVAWSMNKGIPTPLAI